MNKFSKTALACAITVLLAACGEGTSNQQARSPAFAGVTGTQTAAAVAADYKQAVQHIYLAYFGRPADPAGLEFFAGRFAAFGAPTNIIELNSALSSNASIKAIVDVFSTSQESQDLYGGDNSAFIDAVYQSLFSRAPDSAGKDYWVAALNNGAMTRAAAALNIMVSAQGTDIDIIAKKAQVAANFTAALDLGVEQRGYSGLDANVVVRNLLSQVNLGTDVAAFQPNINSTVAALAEDAPPGAEGAYRSPLPGSGNTDIDTVVLENDEYFAVYGRTSPSQFIVSNFIHGTGISGATAFTSTNMLDFGPKPPAVPTAGTLSAAYVPGVSMTGSITIPAGTIPLTSTKSALAPFYSYAAPANLSDLDGTWRMNERTGNLSTVVVNNGSFTGTNTLGCSFTGTLAPRASNKNVFNATITYGAAPCALAGQTVNGIALSYLFNTGATRQLIVLGKNAARTGAEYLSGSAATPLGMVASLQTTDLQAGTGATAAANDQVVVHYTGWIYSANAPEGKGAQFDTSRTTNQPLNFKLGTGVVIAGWDQGLVGMQAGGKRRLVIPASMAYGVNGSGTKIPGNASLVFDVEMVSVTKP
ncbi:FKBP-type peptidyl-prolyl cis-trans isomerase [Pseudoduganella sp. GCM10020061]|uniref:FKBP-type peptidyl-prolyl cis-trans isomerase n=1 Tax=Pseudoduganella sp. GCM10020061 TaxID=3317345 RepID=UPI00362F95B4